MKPVAGKILSAFTFTLVALILLAGCAPTAAPPKPSDAQAPPAEVEPKPTALAEKPQPAAPVPTKPASAQLVKLKMGSLGVSADAGNFIAYKKGYFKEQGIELEFIKFDSGAGQIAPLSTGEIHVGRGVLSVGLFNALQRGIDLKLVADAKTTPATPAAKEDSAVMVRKDLADTIKTEKDLKGRTLVLTGQGISLEIELERLLEKGGLTPKEVNIQYLGMPDTVAALGSKAVDVAVTLGEPFVTQAQEKDVAVYWKGFSHIYPNHTISVLMYSPKFAAEMPQVANRFALAYVKGVREYYDAFFKNKNTAEVIAILTEMTNIKDPAVYRKIGPHSVNPDGYINTKSVIDDQEFFFAKGQIKEKVDLSKVIDNSFVDYAVQQLGKYK